MFSRRGICLCCASIVIPALLLAQTKALSGSYGGTLGGSALSGTPATVELKVGAGGELSGEVTGPKLTPGDLQGTYDFKTGAVRFSVRVRDANNPQSYGFVGTLRNDTLVARNSGEETRVFTMHVVRGVKAPALVAGGPQNPADPALASAQRGFTEVSGWVARAAALVPAERYSYKPVGTVRSFGELIGHIADSYGYYCSRASGREVEWSDAIEKGAKDKATLAGKLKTAQDGCSAAYAKGQIGPLFENVAHTNLHYGNIITYMRMMGLTPPSS